MDATLTLHGEEEKFTIKTHNHYLRCSLKRFWLQEWWALIQLECFVENEPLENFAYSGMCYENAKTVKLKSETNGRLPYTLRKALNEKIGKKWKICFV